MNLENFQRQHKDVYELLDELEGYVVSRKYDSMQAEMAKVINVLAGKLRIHLDNEDKYLYPNLLKDEKFRALAKEYMDEMGGVSQEFFDYKDKYNTRTKIQNATSDVVKDTKYIIDKIRKRMKKEEDGIYTVI